MNGPSGDTTLLNPIFGFCMNCLAVMNSCQATRVNWLEFGILCILGYFEWEKWNFKW